MRALFFIVLIALLLEAPATAQSHCADMVILGARVWTVNPKQPQAEAVAIGGDRIVAVGENAVIKEWIGPGTQVLQAAGRRLLPGFIDSHVHFLSGGFQLLGVDLRSATTESDFSKRISDKALSLPAGEWITGGGWDHQQWPSMELPKRSLIDAGTPKTPILVTRHDGHMALANSLALRLAGIDRRTPDPPGGQILKDAVTGEPSGILKDSAMDLVWRFVPEPSEQMTDRAALAAVKEAARFGVTSVQDMGDFQSIRAYQRMARRHELSVRIYAAVPLPLWERLAAAGIQRGFGDTWLSLGAVKGFMDGSLGSSTALMFESFSDEPGNRGLPNEMALPEGNLKKLARAAATAGFQVVIHGIGDKANHDLLDLFDAVSRELALKNARFRIEHAQHLLPADIPRFASLGVIAAMQPYHAIDDGRWAEKRLGPDRIKTTYAFHSLLESGARVAFGSDWTVAPLNPLLGIYAAVTRRTTDGKHPGGWIPEQKITVSEAIQCYTLNSAFASFEENSKGSIECGKLADMVLLDRDPFIVPSTSLKDVLVDVTIAGGKIVYSREPQTFSPGSK
jgi:predicted amidohydrolase YtcJ